MKKYICMILAVIMIAATLTACGGNETKKVEPSVATFFVSLPPQADRVAAIIITAKIMQMYFFIRSSFLSYLLFY